MYLLTKKLLRASVHVKKDFLYYVQIYLSNRKVVATTNLQLSYKDHRVKYCKHILLKLYFFV